MRSLAKLLNGHGCRWMALAAVAVLAGSTAARAVITDVATGDPVRGASYITEYAGELYFRGSIDPSSPATQLWRSDGTTAVAVTGVPADVQSMAVFQDKLFIGVSAGAVVGSQLWQYDAATGVAQQAPGAAANARLPQEMAAYGGNLYFRASNFSTVGIELWKFNGATQTPIDLWPGTGSSYPQHFVEYNGQLYFNSAGAPGPGPELWRTDGGAPVRATNIYPGSGSSPESLAVYNGQLYFSADDGVHGRELWRYDGASASLAADIVPGVGYASSSFPSGLTVYNNRLYFSANDGVHGFELWSYDGANPPSMVAEINPTPIPPLGDPNYGDNWLADSSPAGLTVFDGKLYFSAIDGVHGRELWSYDGVNPPTLVADINPGQYGSEVGDLMVYNGQLFFTADGGFNPLVSSTAEPAMMSLSEVPEPGSLALLLCGATALLWRWRRTSCARRASMVKMDAVRARSL